MKFRSLKGIHVRCWLNLLILAAFVLVSFFQYADDDSNGDDLSSSFVGCRLMSNGLARDHLYKSDPEDFSAIGLDAPWQDEADRGGFAGYLHPYVQTPLWAFVLEPTCERMTFFQFKAMFALIMLSCFAAMVWLVARFWAPVFLHPLALALVTAALACSQPFRYAMFLMQTHIMFLLFTVAALILAEKGYAVTAGFLLAVAAAVKITPILLLLYWLVTRRWKASASLLVSFTVLTVASIVVGGLPLYQTYLAQLDRLAHTLLISQNNQSLASWWMTRFYPADQVQEINSFRLPAGVRNASTLLTLLCTFAGALLDRMRIHREGSNLPPYGAVAAVLAATLFAPIAWTHYFIVLLIPVMLLWHARSALPAWAFYPLMTVMIALNFPPLASDVVHGEVGRFAVLRGQFFAGILSLMAMLSLAWKARSGLLLAPSHAPSHAPSPGALKRQVRHVFRSV